MNVQKNGVLTAHLMDVEKYGVCRIVDIASDRLTIGVSKPCGTVSIVPAHSQLYLENMQRRDRAVHGQDLYRRIKGMRNLTAENLGWLSQNEEFFPEAWKERSSAGLPLFPCFWGTDVTDAETGDRVVLCTWWDHQANLMDVGFKPVNSFFGDNFPAAQAVG